MFRERSDLYRDPRMAETLMLKSRRLDDVLDRRAADESTLRNVGVIQYRSIYLIIIITIIIIVIL